MNVKVSDVREKVKEACGKMAMVYHEDILSALKKAQENEEGISKTAVNMLLENAEIAANEQIPICQDTGMVIAYVHLSQEVHIEGGALEEAIQLGVEDGYKDYYLRASVVDDPLFQRVNTRTNTPAIIYYTFKETGPLEIELMAKGFGSENMSRVAMLKPAQGVQGVKDFVLETIRLAGPNACPPMVVGVGIGGTFDYCACLSKKALLRSLEQSHPDPEYARLEEELTQQANELKIGPMGLHGKTTVLKVQIESFPTHIAGLPVAVNICCHACRHERLVF